MRNSGPLRTLFAGVLVALALALFGRSQGAEGQPTGADDAAPIPTAAPAATATPTPTPTKAPAVTYAARPRGSRAVVALTIRGDRAIAYVCDGVSVETWMRGKVYPEGLMRLDAVKGPGFMIGAIEDDAVTGTVSLRSGRPFSYRIPPVKRPSGLYRATGTTTRGARLVGGWIVLPSGQQVGLVNLDGKSRPAPRLRPEEGSVVIDGGPVKVGPADPAGP